MTRPIVTSEYDQFIPYNSPDFLFIDWDLGNTCNFSCSYCASFVHDGSIPWVNIDKVDNLIEQIRDNYQSKEFRLYNLLGGEPTAYPKLPQLIKKIKSLNNNQNLDARFWVQKLLLRKSLNSLKH